jgi:gamma-glutamyltranspeptidase/glutathione hydrolase
VIKNPDLAATLRRSAAQGDKGFYEGTTAELIVAEMKRSGGIISAEDLAKYRAVWREPVATEIRGHRVLSMPPPSSGGIALVMLANILGGYPPMQWHSPLHLHRTAEAMKRVFADRNELLADPDFVTIDLATLASRGYAEERRATIRDDAATPSTEVVAGLTVEETETTHFSVVDRDGMAVALTTTINLLYGSGVTVTGAGFLLNDEMDDFSTNPGKQNALGLVQGKRNVVEPGKRPLSSMSPTVVVGPDGKVVLVTGSRGGGRIITAVYQVLSNVLDFGMDVMAAVAAPRIHHQHMPDAIGYEARGLPDGVRAALEQKGHELRPLPEVQSVPTLMRTRDGWAGTADPRREGTAAGH